jgi:hypothetical protein
MMPILHTIRELLKFKDYTTISEIASTAGLPRKQVLETINRNGHFVWRERKNGHITKVDPQASLREHLWKSGRYYRKGTYGAWGVEGHCLEFEGNQELRERLIETRRIGGFGDSYDTKIVIDTPENRAALEETGLRPWEEAVIDDSLWAE